MNDTEEEDRGRGRGLGDQVYTRLRTRITSGELGAGILLPRESDFAEQLGVSRTVLREALARLRHEGLVESKRGTGTRVLGASVPSIFAAAAPHSIADLEACYEFRMGLEPEVAALAARRRNAGGLDLIRQAHRAFEACAARDELGAAEDLAFHAAIAAATRNDYYIQTIAAIAKPVEVGLGIAKAFGPLRAADRLAPTIAEHRAIVESIGAQDPEAARAAMRAHVRASRDRVFQGR